MNLIRRLCCKKNRSQEAATNNSEREVAVEGVQRRRNIVVLPNQPIQKGSGSAKVREALAAAKVVVKPQLPPPRKAHPAPPAPPVLLPKLLDTPMADQVCEDFNASSLIFLGAGSFGEVYKVVSKDGSESSSVLKIQMARTSADVHCSR